ncbi:MAG: glycosyltransferase family 4 protein [Alcaligenaceae bacterium]|nr:glycosyltransferase family 4 protein [Alcaligenaceae bacterium]
MIFSLVLGALLAWVLTDVLRHYALKRNVLDIPNARSSHTRPTPRGGGVAFVLVFTVFAAISTALPITTPPGTWALIGASLIVAITGFIDDHHPLPARWRLVGHAAGAGILLWSFGGVPPLTVFGYPIHLGMASGVLGLLYIIWLLNLYNFMDGIDGLAAAQTLCVALGGAALYSVLGHTQLIWLPLLLAGSVTGFLIWNFPPAKIFMGDAGSGFLGITLAAFSLRAGHIDPNLFYCWLILSGVFICDATFTLLRRLLNGEKVYQAHRSHAYQYASRRFASHKTVTLSVVAINLLWLFPLALLTALRLIDGTIALLVAYAPLIALAWAFSAGKPEARPDTPSSNS